MNEAPYILIVLGEQVYGGHIATFQEFKSQTTCEKACDAIMQASKKDGGKAIYAMCVEK